MDGRVTLTIGAIIAVTALFGCSASQGPGSESEIREPRILRPSQRVGTPNPAAVYCHALGYKFKILEDRQGNQRGICVFPDGSECGDWDFYRGKQGQKWSYCERCGYGLKDIGPYEGSVRGAVCIDKSTGEEVGTVFDLVVDKFLKGQPLIN